MSSNLPLDRQPSKAALEEMAERDSQSKLELKDGALSETDDEDHDVVVASRVGDASTRPHFVFRTLLHKDARISKLATREDKYHLHKTLGILAVCSFLYRYGVVYNRQGNLGFDHGMVIDDNGNEVFNHRRFAFDVATMLVHLCLALSSIIFKVPRKRIANKPMVIYEEYRLHAMVFTLRCFCVFACCYFLPGKSGHALGVFTPPLAVLACHLLADRVTSIHGTQGNTAVRANAKNVSGIYKYVALVYSLYQFLAIGSHLLPNMRLADMGYNAIIAIQSSAFLMTLYRKRIIRGTTHMVVYSSCLIISGFHIVRVIGPHMALLVTAAFVLRMHLPRAYSSKYLIWTMFVASAHAPWLVSQLIKGSAGGVAVIANNGDLVNIAKGLAVSVLLQAAFSFDQHLRKQASMPAASPQKAQLKLS